MKPVWLSVEDLAVIHGEVIEATGGVPGVVNPGGMESALARPFITVSGKETFSSLDEKVAALVEGIVVFHPFADGNKRTALVAADVCLRLNGRRLSYGSKQEAEDFFWAIARGEKPVAEIVGWVKPTAKPSNLMPRRPLAPSDPPIAVRGARVHNLKNISCDIPARAMTVFTGVSGSGKSSLAFDTLYAEGQRRYVESLSAYARQFLERMEKPDVDSIEGLFPAVAVEQRIPAKGKRSTVGTATEASDLLRLLFARAGRPMCPEGHGRVARKSAADVVDYMFSRLPAGARLFLTYPMPLAGETPSADLARELVKEGYRRAFVNGRLTEVDSWPEETLGEKDRVLVVVDRVALDPGERARLAESVEACMRAGRGWVVLREAEGAEHPFSEHFLCDICGREAPDPEPTLFSFNHPRGACPACKGFGNVLSLDEQKIVPDPSLSLEDGAVEPWDKESREDIFLDLLAFARANGVRTGVPYKSLTERERKLIWKGEGAKRRRGGYPGVEGFFERLQAKSYKIHVRVYMSRYRRYADCETCAGARLRGEALWFQVGGRNIAEVSAMTVDGARRFLSEVDFSREERAAAKKILEELETRLRYLHEVGLGYLALDRLAATLSGGEAQRIMLATLLGTALTGTMMILDEPTVGLHPRDTERLLGILKSLRDAGNTLIVVEHDPAVIRGADHVVELGPGAGGRGGEIVASAGAAKFRRAETLTAAYMRGERSVPLRRESRPLYRDAVVLRGVRLHNLDGITVSFPWGGMIAVTGVSGSGKSTLVRDVLLREFERYRDTRGEKPLHCESVEGFDKISGMTAVDQSPLGRSARSNALTVSGALAPIRALFAATPDARAMRLAAGHFSFNSPKGRCPACEGLGMTEVDMQFLSNVRLVCDVCEGRRFRTRVLDAEYRGHSIHDVMEATVNEAAALFADRPEVTERLAPLRDAGLGYLRLGQPTSTLSGGESQRLKLASALGARRANAMYIFDEPTTGLHLDDVAVLLGVFDRLVARGNTLVVVEHHMDVVKNADWVIDMGPEAGDGGGRVVAEGPPEEVAKSRDSHTARFLREALAA